jgi:predicted  nucleic acid-binding Zn-ribbon protein
LLLKQAMASAEHQRDSVTSSNHQLQATVSALQASLNERCRDLSSSVALQSTTAAENRCSPALLLHRHSYPPPHSVSPAHFCCASDLRTQLADSEQRERALGTRLNDALMDLKAASKRQQQQQDVIGKLEQQVSQMRDTVHSSHATANENTKTLAEVRQHLNAARDEKSRMESALFNEGQSHSRVVEDFQARINKLTGNEASLQSEVQRLTLKNASLSNDLMLVHKECKLQAESATYVRKALQESDSENRNLKASVLRLEEKCAGLELQVASLEQQLQDEKLLHLSANKKVKGLEEHTEELRASLQRPMDEVLQQYRTVSAELQLCRSNYAIISSERVALEVELKAHQEQVQLLLRKMSLLEADLLDFHSLRHSESNLRQQLSEMQKKYDAAQLGLDRSSALCRNLELRLDSAQSHASRLQQDLNSKASRNADLEELSKANSSNMSAMQAHVRQLEEECTRLKKLLDDSVDMRIVAAKMTELETLARSSSNALVKQKSEKNAAAEKIRDLTQQLETAARQITQGEAQARQLQLLQKQLEESEKECEGLKRQRQVSAAFRVVFGEILCVLFEA